MEETKENQKNGDNSPENKGSANEENQRFRRSNRGKRIQNLNEEQLKEDEAFWKNNPLFKDIEDDEDDDEEDENNNNDENDDEAEYEDDFELDADFEALAGEEEDTSYQIEIASNEANENGEEEEVDPSKLELLQKLAANREKHFFHRPIFIKCFIDECERSNFSYIKVPDAYPMLPASNENEISKNVINNTYIGVPPKAPKEYLTTPHFPNYFEYELFKMEDERYHLDSNILKYRAIIQTLDQIIADEDSSRRTLRIAKLSKSYVNYANFLTEKKVVKQKLEVSEIEDEIEKLKAIQSDISHDLENIIKKRDISDSNTKKKKETYYQLAIKHQEICYAEEEKELYSNSSFETLFLLIIEFIEELSKKYVLVQNLKETSENEEFLKLYKENLLFHYHEKLLYQNDKLLDQISKQVLEFAKDFKENSNNILPSEILLFKNETIISLAYELTITYVKNNNKLYDKVKNPLVVYHKEKIAKVLTSFLKKIFINGNYQKIEEVNDVIDEEKLNEYVSELTSYNTKSKKNATNETVDFDVIPCSSNLMTVEYIQKDKMLPKEVQNDDDHELSSSFYGTHYFYYLFKYFYSLYQKLLVALALSHKDELVFQKMVFLTKSVLVDKFDETKYYLALFNLYGSNAKYLFHMKHLIHNITQIIMSLIYDNLSDKLLSFENYEPSPDNFIKVGSLIRRRNGVSSEIKHYLYKFYFDGTQNILYIGISKPPEIEFITEASENEETNKEHKEEKNNKRKEPPENIEDAEPKMIKKVLS